MSDHHHSSHKKNQNRKERRAENHALHEETLDVNEDLKANLGEFEDKNIQTGAGSHTPGANKDDEWAVDERQAEANDAQ